MRWPFGRRSTPTERATAPGSEPGMSPAAARPRDAWRSLPAVQRTIGRPPVVAPAAPFADRLATRQSPDLALAPLGHEVSPLASPGVLIGLATTDAANTGRIELPVQRHATESHGTDLESRGWSQFDEPDDEIAAVSDGGLETVTLAPAVSASTSSGLNVLPAAAASVQRLAAAAPILTASAATAVAAPPAGTFDLRPRSAGASQAPIAAGPVVTQRAVVSAGAAAATVIDAAPPARRPTLGQARRLGLGAPLPAGPDGSVQRLPASDRAIPAVGPLGGAADGARPSGKEAGQPVLIGASSPGAAPVQEAPAAAGTDAGAPAAVAPAALTVVRPVSIQRLAASLGSAAPDGVGPAASGAAAPSAEVTRERVIQRLPFAGGDPSSGDRPAPAGAPEPATGGEPAAGIALSAMAEPVGRSPIRASSAGSLLDPPLPAGRARASATTAREPGGPAQPFVARSMADPSRSSPAVNPSGAGLAGRPTTVQREAVGPLVPRASAGATGPADPLAGAGSAGSPAGGPSVQRAVEVRELVITTQADNRGPAGEPAPGAAPGSAGSSATAPAAAGAPPSIADRDRELDELARRLYGRIRTKLAAELLADRERAGLLVDLR